MTAAGTVWSRREGRLRKIVPAADEEGYLRVRLRAGGCVREIPVHRLVAAAWCPGWHPSLEVHHLDGDPANNRAGNLLCVTAGEHARMHGIWVDGDVVARERRRANELIAASRPARPGEPALRGLMRAAQDAERALAKRGISL